MATKARFLGKLSPPETSGLLLRERLFRRLDLAREGNLIWVSAPAGAGKTTLLASWARARHLPLMWYQLDAGDGDLASFFLCLSRVAGPRRKLPRLAPEHLMAPEPFARHYFTRLFQTWSSPRVLVLDNYHQLPLESPVHAVVNVALELLPRGSVLAVASRRQAPEPLSIHYAYASTVSLGWDELRFTPSESKALARLWKMDSRLAGRLHGACDGWAAMQVLVMRLGSDAYNLPSPAQANLVSNYIEREFYLRLPEAERALLPVAALPPFITAEVARELSGREDAGALIERLSNEHLLISRYEPQGGERRYQFHPILREFLLLRLARERSQEEARGLKARAARLLETRGEVESAAELLVEAQNWPEMVRLACTHAPRLMDSGRLGILQQWIERIPQSLRDANAWLLFWQGTLMRLENPIASRHFLERAHSQFVSEDDMAGIYLSWAAIVESFAAPWSNFAELEGWLGKLAGFRAQYGEPVDPQVLFPVLNAGLTTFIGAPYNPFFAECLERAKTLILESSPASLVGPFIWPIALKAAWSGVGIEEARSLAAQVSATREQAFAHPLGYLVYSIGRVYLEASSLEPDQADAWASKGLELAEATGIHLVDSLILAGQTYTATIAGDPVRARQALERMRGKIAPTAVLDQQQAQYLDAGIRLMAGDAGQALLDLADLPERTAAMCAVGPTRFAELLKAQALTLDGQNTAARALLSGPRDLAERLPSPMTGFQADLVEAYSWFMDGDRARGLAVLARAMAAGRQLNAMAITPFWLPQLLSPLCRLALEEGIEVDYVIRLIRTRGLLPDTPAADHWPWSVRIHTLGRFGVLRNDTPLVFSGKAQKRPLNLLKALIALGGRGVSTHALIEAVWDEEAGDGGRHNLEMAVSRLRKLLGNEATIYLQDGKLSLNDKLVWVDAWAFERLAGEWQNAGSGQRDRLAWRALERYTGTFLAEEEAAPWLLGRRDRLRSRYLRIARAQGEALELAERWQEAAEAYQRAIEFEGLAEELYQGLIRCHLALKERAQALEVFRRCRQMLSVVLGVAPSAQTVALAQQAHTL